MCVESLLVWVGRIPKVVGVESAIGRLLASLPAQEINSPPNVHIMPKFCVSNDHFTHALTIIFIGVPEFFPAILRFVSSINILVWSVGAVVVVEYDLFVRGVELVSFLPVHVRHPNLLP